MYIYIDLYTEIKAPINADTNIILTHLLADYFFIGDAGLTNIYKYAYIHIYLSIDRSIDLFIYLSIEQSIYIQ